jgi:hypothetical protein
MAESCKLYPMRTLPVVLCLSALASAAPSGWHRTLDDGLSAARKNGKPVLVVTIWKEKV